MDYKDFRRKLSTDTEFARKFDGCETLEALIAAAAREGYSFTVEDIKNDTDLLPEEVAFVAGGVRTAAQVIATDFNVSGAFTAHKIIGG